MPYAHKKKDKIEMAEYWMDIQGLLNRVANVYGNGKMYEKLVPVVLSELKANEGKKCVFDLGNIAIINKELVESFADILKTYGLKSNNIYAAFASYTDKERFRELLPEDLVEYLIPYN